MRIIAGTLRRRSIRVPPGRSVRPTTDQTREAIFNMLMTRVDFTGARVLDLFAGSGALGFEALSRGAAEAVFVERDARIARVIRDNAAQLDVEPLASIVVEDALRFVGRYRASAFDLAFADPPYDFPGVHELPDRILRLVKPDGILILEHGGRHDFGDHSHVLAERSYGRTHVSFFRPQRRPQQPE